MKTVADVKAATVALAAAITALLQSFEDENQCVIHSVPVRPASSDAKVTAEVKVQIAR
jgi:hypothetical protein